ncbi:MAG: UvrB/UvrC motif-containing protein, partial [Pseudomonadota bacterium]|nr:UvrB/UvrC motif-containing protein [Pseudomonadota bacterium]
ASKTKLRGSIQSKTLSDDILNSKPISNIASEIKKLEEKMYQHAKNLEFEEAARVRDLLTKLRERSLAS